MQKKILEKCRGGFYYEEKKKGLFVNVALKKQLVIYMFYCILIHQSFQKNNLLVHYILSFYGSKSPVPNGLKIGLGKKR